jgi:hypothetical protein
MAQLRTLTAPIDSYCLPKPRARQPGDSACLRWALATGIAVLAATLRAWPVGAAADGAAAPVKAPLYTPDPVSRALQTEFEGKKFALDTKSGNYLGPKVFLKTKKEDMVPVLIGSSYAKDLRGRTVFVRQSIRDKLLIADAALFKDKKAHLKINYGFRSNALQHELFQKLSGKGKVAPAGMSFHETGMAVDLGNWQDAQKFMIDAGFVGGCFGIEEDLVHYSIDEVTKASNLSAFKRCTLKDIPKEILKGFSKVGDVTVGLFRKNK